MINMKSKTNVIYQCTDELYVKMYKCLNCNNPYVIEDSNFCNTCGSYIENKIYEKEVE